jgi:hypothetical protein
VKALSPNNSPEERQDLKEAILEGLENAGSDRKAYEPAFVQAFGPGPGVLMSQLFFWTGKGMDPAGWIYKPEHEWRWETGLSRDQQRKARKILKAKGVLEEEKRGLPRKLYFRIRLERLAGVVLESLNQRYSQTPKACQSSEEPKGCLACRAATGPSLLQRVLPGVPGEKTNLRHLGFRVILPAVGAEQFELVRERRRGADCSTVATSPRYRADE